MQYLFQGVVFEEYSFCQKYTSENKCKSRDYLKQEGSQAQAIEATINLGFFYSGHVLLSRDAPSVAKLAPGSAVRLAMGVFVQVRGTLEILLGNNLRNNNCQTDPQCRLHHSYDYFPFANHGKLKH